MYRAPVDDILSALGTVRLPWCEADGVSEVVTDEDARIILEQAGSFSTQEILPLAAIGDQSGALFNDHAVRMPPGWQPLYRRWVEAGWGSISAPQEFGGQGLPFAIAAAVSEIWNSSSMAFGICPTLTMGAVAAIAEHGSEALQQTYLRKLVTGEWTGTMNLTEPQSGSDLSGIRTRAERAGDGTYRLFGQKIFITYGEHDLSDNIVHLVLARLSDAPAGTRGLSLFLVPKLLVNDDGSLGPRNDVFCISIEHKLGLHASPTCTMLFGDGLATEQPPGAVGWLIGSENAGLRCMFTMMNHARLTVAVQGVAVAEAAYQKALAYATDRRQGVAPGVDDRMTQIVNHPDVQRNLLSMKALTMVARLITMRCAHALDMARSASINRDFWEDRAGLLTPVAKAFATDIGFEVASTGVQIHGGAGYIEETGAARLLRDARIAPIYEGTNGIQAIDLVTRKLPHADGQHVFGFLAELRNLVGGCGASERLTADIGPLNSSLDTLETATSFLLSNLASGRRQAALAGATPYLRLFAIVTGGCYLAHAALLDDSGRTATLLRFFSANILTEATDLSERVLRGAKAIETASALLSG